MPDLGTYAVEVLSAYGVSLMLLAALLLLTRRASARARATLDAAEQEAGRNG